MDNPSASLQPHKNEFEFAKSSESILIPHFMMHEITY